VEYGLNAAEGGRCAQGGGMQVGDLHPHSLMQFKNCVDIGLYCRFVLFGRATLILNVAYVVQTLVKYLQEHIHTRTPSIPSLYVTTT
jgi:hypothetical protein